MRWNKDRKVGNIILRNTIRMKKIGLIAAVALGAVLLAGCSLFADGKGGEDLSRFEGTWEFSYEQNGKELENVLENMPTVELCSDGRSVSFFRKNGVVTKAEGFWTVENGFLVMQSKDGKVSSRFRLVSDEEARSAIDATEHLKQRTVIVLKKKSAF